MKQHVTCKTMPDKSKENIHELHMQEI